MVWAFHSDQGLFPRWTRSYISSKRHIYSHHSTIEAVLWRRNSCRQTDNSFDSNRRDAVSNRLSSGSRAQLRFRVVELTTLNIALLGRQPKCSKTFSSFQVLLFIFSIFRVLVVSVIGVSACLFNFRMRGYK